MEEHKGRRKRHQNGENQQEESLLNESQQRLALNPELKQDKRHYIPFLPRVYWFFYRKPIYFLAFLPSFLKGCISIGRTISLGLIIDAINKENGLQLIKKYAFYQFLAAIINGTLSMISRYSWNQINSLIRIKMQRVLFKSMMTKDVEFFDRRDFGELLTVMTSEVRKAENIFSAGKASQITTIGNLISGLSFCFMLEWRLTLFAIIFTFLQSRLSHSFREYCRNRMKAGFKIHSEINTIASEVVSNIRTIFSFNREAYDLERYQEYVDASCDSDVHTKLMFTTVLQISHVLNRGALCMFLNIGSFFVLKDDITPGFLFSLSTEAFSLAHQISSLFNSFQNEQQYLDSADKIYEIIDYVPSVPFTEERTLENFSGNIEFRNVWFKYPTRNAWVLKNVNLTINSGDITAFVGHSGSGKSTTLQLILRFYDCTSGQILFDGVDIRELDPRWIHKVFSVVQQDPVLFTISIRDNVCYGLDDEMYQRRFGITNIDEQYNNTLLVDEIQHCLEIAQAADFVDKLPDKMDTMIGEKGAKLSGGQKQRIAIARAVIRDPIVMITDEATSALDAQNEKKVQKAIDEAMQGRTSIIIAHRLGTISKAKMIYVFDQAEIVESGSREELLAKKGAFYTLVERQLNLNTIS